MPYKILFDKDRTPVVTFTDIENQSKLWKTSPISDQVFIKVTGRNVHSWKDNVTFSISDHLMKIKKGLSSLIIVLLFNKDENKPYDFALAKPYLKVKKYPINRPISELATAIAAVDSHYAQAGGGVFYKHTILNTPGMIEKLETLLQSICEEKET